MNMFNYLIGILINPAKTLKKIHSSPQIIKKKRVWLFVILMIYIQSFLFSLSYVLILVSSKAGVAIANQFPEITMTVLSIYLVILLIGGLFDIFAWNLLTVIFYLTAILQNKNGAYRELLFMNGLAYTPSMIGSLIAVLVGRIIVPSVDTSILPFLLFVILITYLTKFWRIKLWVQSTKISHNTTTLQALICVIPPAILLEFIIPMIMGTTMMPKYLKGIQ